MIQPKKSLAFVNLSNAQIYLIALVAFLIRIPGIFHENIPHQFCDEAIYSDEVNRMLETKTLITRVFLSGGMNIYPTYFFARVLSALNYQISNYDLITITRLAIVFLNAVTVLILYKISLLITKSFSVSRNASLIFAFSGYAISQTRIWYPDSVSVFIYSVVFLQVLKLSEFSKSKNHIYLGLLMGIAISVKYNLAIVVIIYIYKMFTLLKNKFAIKKLVHNISVCGFACLCTFLLINFSLFGNFNKFHYDVATNAHIYRPGPGVHFSAPFFYTICLLIIPFTLMALPFLMIGFRKMSKENLILIILPVIIYIVIMSRADQVLNRNINAFIALISIFLALGLQAIMEKKNLLKTISISGFLLFFAFQSGYTIYKEVQHDSYVEAENWLRTEIPEQEVVGVNQACFYENEAVQAGLKTDIDPFMKKKYDYYVFNSYWESYVFPSYTDNNIMQELATKYLHFYHYSDDNLFKFNLKRDIENSIPQGYSVLKVFRGSGEDILVLRKKM